MAFTLRTFAIVVGVVLAARIAALVSTPLNLHGDEAQYWLWSRTLDWGYFSKPPLVAWVIAATTGVFGNAEWAVRLAAPIAHAAASLVLYALGSRMAGREVGFFAGLGWLLMPGVWLSSSLISTDALLLPLWAGAVYALWRLQEGEPGSWRWALLLGACVGFGLLAKYAMGYVLLCAALAAWWNAGVRRALLGRAGLIAGAVALVLIGPNLIWNARNGFATLEHTAANAAWEDAGPNLEGVANFLVDQLGLAGPVLFPLLLIAAWRALKAGRDADPRARFLLAFVLPPLVIILVQALISRAHGNWAATAYPAAITLIALTFAERGRRWLQAATGLHAAFGALFLAAVVLPPLANAIGLGNALKRVRGWEETAAIVMERARADANQPYTAVMVDNRLVFNDLSYYWRDADPPPLRMWLLLAAPHNQAERMAPMRPADGARVLIVSTTPPYVPIIQGDFARTSAPQRVTIDLGGGKTRVLTFMDGYGFEPAVRDAAFIARIRPKDD